MVAAVSLISVVLGATLAAVAERYPAHVATIETSAGALMIGGLLLLGSGLPVA